MNTITVSGNIAAPLNTPAVDATHLATEATEAASRQDWPMAEALWREAMRAAPTIWQFQMSRATAIGRQDRALEAQSLLAALTKQVPHESAPWSALAHLFEQQSDWPEAERHWRRFLALDQSAPWAHAGLARALRLQKKFAEAETVLADAILRFEDEPQVSIEHARVAQDRLDWPQALVRWHDVRARFPTLWDGHGGQVRALTELGRIAEADAELEAAAPAFADHAGALHTLAVAAETRGDWAMAQRHWRGFLSVAPRVGWAHTALARVLDKLGRADEANAVRTEVVALLPDDLAVRTELARLAESRRDWPGALDHWQAVRRQFPKLLAGYVGQAHALAELHRIDDAQAILLAATMTFPGDIEPAQLLAGLRRRWAAGIPGDLPVPETAPFETVSRSHNGRGYLTPTTLRVTPQAPLRIAMVGSCQLDGWQLPLAAPAGTIFETLTVNNLSPMPDRPRAEVAAFDFMLIQMPIRAILYDGALWRLAYDDIDGFQAIFDMCCSRVDQMLENWMKWNEQHGLLTFVANFLVPQDGGMGRLFPRYDLRNTQYFFERLNEHLEQTVRIRANAYLFDIDRIVASLGRRFIQDDAVEFVSHGSVMPMPGPVTDRMEPVAPLGQHYDIDWPERFGPAVWGELLAMLRSVRQVDPVKLVVVDLDDTMWKGISGDMADLDPSEMLGFWPMGFAEALTWLKKRGILLAILSKNEESRIREIFPKIYGPKLPLSEFAAVVVNWRPKAESMAEILETMSLLPRNVVFIDDNPGERAAMQQAFPQMRIIGRYPYYLRRMLLWSAETQVAGVTAESGKRTEMIQRQFERESKRRVLPRADFLRDAAPQVTLVRISNADHPRFARVMELVNKTNQFNTTGRRWKQEELRALLADGGGIMAFEVADNFTAYGLVGVVLIRGREIVQWVMSCRVLGYQIEQAVMARLVAGMEDGGPVTGCLIETDVNFPCRGLFGGCGFVQVGTLWTLAAGSILQIPPHVNVNY